ncbi:MAG: hypothetical protein KF805_14360 [Phycisphaeraceae bacterium]|nr:hypothetical protein [Phycisphaeraceae bacterium]
MAMVSMLVVAFGALRGWSRVLETRLYFKLRAELRADATVILEEREESKEDQPAELIDIGLVSIPKEPDVIVKSQGLLRLAKSSRWSVAQLTNEWLAVPPGMSLRDRSAPGERELTIWKCLAMHPADLQMVNLRLMMDVMDGTTLTRVFEFPQRSIAISRPSDKRNVAHVTFENKQPARFLSLFFHLNGPEASDEEILDWATKFSFHERVIEKSQSSEEPRGQ